MNMFLSQPDMSASASSAIVGGMAGEAFGAHDDRAELQRIFPTIRCAVQRGRLGAPACQTAYQRELAQVVGDLSPQGIQRIVAVLHGVWRTGRQVYILGEAESALCAEYLARDLMRLGMCAVACDESLPPLHTVLRAGDALLIFCAQLPSLRLLEQTWRVHGVKDTQVVACTGAISDRLAFVADTLLTVPSRRPRLVRDTHLFVAQLIRASLRDLAVARITAAMAAQRAVAGTMTGAAPVAVAQRPSADAAGSITAVEAVKAASDPLLPQMAPTNYAEPAPPSVGVGSDQRREANTTHQQFTAVHSRRRLDAHASRHRKPTRKAKAQKESYR